MHQCITFIGHLGNEPELRYTKDGKAMLQMSVANTQKIYKQDRTTWFRVTVWGEYGVTLAKYLQKGSKVFVSGSLSADHNTGNPRMFTKPDGTIASKFEVVATNVEILSGFKKDSGLFEEPSRVLEKGEFGKPMCENEMNDDMGFDREDIEF